MTAMRGPAFATLGTECVGALGRAAHNNEVAAARRPADAGAATLGSDSEWPGLTEGDDGHDRLRPVPSNPIAMPGDAVSSVPIEVASDPIEPHSIVVAERLRHFTDYVKARWELSATEGSHEPGAWYITASDPLHAFRPVEGLEGADKEGVRFRDPPGLPVDPRAVAQVCALDPGERAVVDFRLGRHRKERTLERDLGHAERLSERLF